ncbi:methyl-CpG-binding domain protein 1-like isoform X6 [Agelaius tricolor]|uniref:methyl-CpG-binding domain protein 1 isoform X8 n=1 Tax=Agelaius phoeniceus TaxID=39638 RepID=UPI0023ECC9F9|nr:methyl-CpG-binding domain protein 1 isoform X8 [Agelaius phoeniceus]
MGTPPRRMAEGWAECPALGPGWQRREAFRKSGATSGRSDTYYKSPTGQKFRSKIELRRFLGPGHDLSNFDFKSGQQRPGPTRTRKSPKWHLPAGPLPEPPKIFKKEEEEVEVEVEVGGAETEKAPPSSVQALPIPIQATPSPSVATPLPEPPHRRTRKRPPLEPPQDGVVALCAGCQSLFPGVSLPPQRRCRWLCPDCRAQRRDFNREQRFYKRVGCGTCQACRIPEDCGICSACARSAPGGPAGPGRTPKCLLRRCLRIVKKGLGCGSCAGCLSTEDCGSCCICLRRLQPGLKRQWRCLRRRCLRPKKARVAKKPQSPRPLTEKWKPLVEREPSDASGARHRKLLNKGKEKKKPGRPPKAPGPRGDKEEPLGGAEKGSRPLPGPPLRLCPIKEESGPLPRLEVRPPGCLGPPLDTWDPPVTPPAPQDPRLGLLIASAPRLKGAPPEPSVAPQRPPPGDLGVLIAATPPREAGAAAAQRVPGAGAPPTSPCPAGGAG